MILLSLFFISLLYFLISFWPVIRGNLVFRLDSDYDMIFSYYSILRDYVLTNQTLPRVHPYAGLGLPLAGDPGISFYNPFFLVPNLIFGIDTGLLVSIFLMIFLSGITMYLFLTSLQCSTIIVLWGSGLYLVSGALAARFAAGHIIFFLTFPAWPIFWWSLYKQHPFVCGGILAYMFLSGDMYSVWFGSLFFGLYLGYKLLQKTLSFRFILLTILFALFLSLPKLYFLIVDVLPIFERTFQSNVKEGSIHIWFTLLPFLVPFKVMFYDRPFFQKYIGFYFNWYEYYSFLSPLPFLFFLGRKRIILRSTRIVLLLIAILFCLLYVALAFPYSPFYWLFEIFPQLHLFRVPQRMYLPLTSLTIILFCLLAESFIKKNPRITYTICISSFLFTALTSIHAIQFAFELPRIKEQQAVTWLRDHDQGEYLVYNQVCCNQRFLVEQNIPILNFYAGWTPTTTPKFSETVRPRYVLASPEKDFTALGYTIIYNQQNQVIWKTNQESIQPSLLSLP